MTLCPNTSGFSRLHSSTSRGKVGGEGCTDVLPPLSPAQIDRNRYIALTICDEFDVKGKLSGKKMIFKDHTFNDYAGYLCIRLGQVEPIDERHCRLDGHMMNAYRLVEYYLGIRWVTGFSSVYSEIDRQDSTNESIKKVMAAVLDRHTSYRDR